jgi:DNA integrity scanning protein DisA with diadenylate cyclase activity
VTAGFAGTVDLPDFALDLDFPAEEPFELARMDAGIVFSD